MSRNDSGTGFRESRGIACGETVIDLRRVTVMSVLWISAASIPVFGVAGCRHARRDVTGRSYEYAKAISELPRHVPSEEARLSLFADYERAAGGTIPLYIVNRTSGIVTLETYDDVIGVGLESLEGDRWAVQKVPRRPPSFCGNSAWLARMGPGEFIRVRGFFPNRGRKRTVRYRLAGHEAVISNTGLARVPAPLATERVEIPDRRLGDIRLQTLHTSTASVGRSQPVTISP